MSRSVEILKWQGKYPVVMKRELLGIDRNMEGEACYEQHIYMYLGDIRLDITSKTPDETRRLVQKLELMGMTS